MFFAENSTAKLECEVAGIPQPKVLWLKNNRPLFESDHCKVVTDGATHTLEFTDIRKGDTGLYTARAMNVNGSTISTAELYVGEGRSICGKNCMNNENHYVPGLIATSKSKSTFGRNKVDLEVLLLYSHASQL